MSKKIIAFGLKGLVTGLLFALLFRPETFGLQENFWGEDISFASLIDELQAVETHHLAFWLLFAVAVKLGGMFCGVVRWRLLLRGQGLHMPFGYMAQSWFVGRFFGIFLVGTVGLDGYRLYDSARYTGEIIKSTTVIAVEKLIGVIALSFLVLVTFPLGYRLLHLDAPILVQGIAGGVFGAALLLLMNPRVMGLALALIPMPRAVRNPILKFAGALAAYTGSRVTLLLALLLGVLVHLGTCLMYFGTASALRAHSATFSDILFTTPLMIWGTVLGPSVGGEGIREAVYIAVLGAKIGTIKAFLISHLGWWVGEFVPFVIGAPIFVLRSRKSRAPLPAQPAMGSPRTLPMETKVAFTPDQLRQYRSRLLECLIAGGSAGLVAGALIGLGEAAWVSGTLRDLREFGALWWGPLFYGPLFVAVGLVLGGVLAFCCLFLDRFPHVTTSFSLILGAAVALAAATIGRFRFARDVLDSHTPGLVASLLLVASAAAAGAIVAVLVARALRPFRERRLAVLWAAVAGYLLLSTTGIVISWAASPQPTEPSFHPVGVASGPNIFLIAIDACRADSLSLYSAHATARMPNLDAFARDAVQFDSAITQASWTKPSFGTIFSGLYPSGHTATSKTASLPEEVLTFPELLQDRGYFTKGFANNPNITAIFNFDQGFCDYVDLRPDQHFAATGSASKLSLYEVLRRLREKFYEEVLGGKLVVTDFYQPAETVTRHALEWLDSAGRPENSPLFLFLHYMETHDPFMDWGQPGVGYARVRRENPDPDRYLEPMKQALVSELEYWDRHFGALMDGLRARRLYDDALIVVVSDHGEEFYDHKGWWHGQTLYEELIHVPLFIKLPQNQQAGRHIGDFARHIDLAPTILHFAGVSKPDRMPGQVLITSDGAIDASPVGFVYAENDFEGIALQAVRTRSAKAIEANPGNKRDLAPVEFYDLLKDPAESTNLSSRNDPRELELRRLISEMHAFIRADAAEPVFLESPPKELKDQLEALGYF